MKKKDNIDFLVDAILFRSREVDIDPKDVEEVLRKCVDFGGRLKQAEEIYIIANDYLSETH